ncbi:hypothetical protein UP87_27340, partial [Escherichia coli]|uniref:hypothetical protein n=1 Tax=Escherichia coli TaxID=562 RepID=UPI000B6B14D1
FIFFFQEEDGIRDAKESRGLGDVLEETALDIRVRSVENGVEKMVSERRYHHCDDKYFGVDNVINC